MEIPFDCHISHSVMGHIWAKVRKSKCFSTISDRTTLKIWTNTKVNRCNDRLWWSIIFFSKTQFQKNFSKKMIISKTFSFLKQNKNGKKTFVHNLNKLAHVLKNYLWDLRFFKPNLFSIQHFTLFLFLKKKIINKNQIFRYKLVLMCIDLTFSSFKIHI